MPRAVAALEGESRRLVRSYAIRIFFAGFALGVGVGEIRFDHFHIVWAEMQTPVNRWWGVGAFLLVAVLMALAARDYWRKIQ